MTTATRTIPQLDQLTSPLNGDEKIEVSREGASLYVTTENLMKVIGALDVVTDLSPTTGYYVPVFKTSDGLPYQTSLADVLDTVGGVPSGGTTGQVLAKASDSDFDTEWVSESGLGTVTSVNVSGGTTGLSFTGGPVTTSGTMTMAGTLATANGGTGVTALGTLSKVDDTNVTLALGGTPSGALIQNVSVTAGWTGQLAVARGGTGIGSTTAYAVLCGGTTSTGALQSLASVGTSGQALVSNGAGALPSFQSLPSAIGTALTKSDDTNVTLTLGGAPTTALLSATSITAGWTGQLAVSRGGTGASTLTQYGVLLGNGTSAIAATAAGTSGYALIGNGSSNPTFQGFLQTGTGATTRTWLAKGQDVVSVKDFGATGDGSTDDYAAIAAAVASGAAEVYFPDGNYRVSQTITLAATIRLVGSARTRALILADHLSGPVITITVGRCSVTDLTISSLSGSARRLASPLGKTPPDASVLGNSMNRGIYVDGRVTSHTFTQLQRLEVINQPGDGINIAGAGSCSCIRYCSINNCGGFGIYADDGDRDGTPAGRAGLWDITRNIIQLNWGQGIALATESSTTVYRFELVNNDVFTNCLGDGGANQPAFYLTFASEVALRGENCSITENAFGFSAVGLVMAESSFITCYGNRFVDNATWGCLIGAFCSCVSIQNSHFTSAPGSGFRVFSDCDSITIDGLDTTELGVIIDAESETLVILNGKNCWAVPGTSANLFYADEMKAATVASGILNVQSGIVDVAGEGGVADTISQIRFASGVNLPDDYRFTLLNRNAYDLILADRTVTGGSANIELEGSSLTLTPNASMSFVCVSNVMYGQTRVLDNLAIETTLTLPNTGLHLLDTNATHDLIIAPGSNLTADRTLTLTTGDANRTLSLGGDLTTAATCSIPAIAQGDILYGSAATALSALAKDANATRYLSNTGSSNNPAWAQVNLANGVTGTLPVANGGTGATAAQSATANLGTWYVLAQSSVAAVRNSANDGTDNVEQTLVTVTVPAGAIGANGRVRVTSIWSYTNSATTKTPRIRYSGTSGTAYLNTNVTTTQSMQLTTNISNRNSASSQVGATSSASTAGGWGAIAAAPVTSTVNTASSTDIVFRCLWGTASVSGENITLESYIVELLYAA